MRSDQSGRYMPRKGKEALEPLTPEALRTGEAEVPCEAPVTTRPTAPSAMMPSRAPQLEKNLPQNDVPSPSILAVKTAFTRSTISLNMFFLHTFLPRLLERCVLTSDKQLVTTRITNFSGSRHVRFWLQQSSYSAVGNAKAKPMCKLLQHGECVTAGLLV